jgi:hypothetical protein
MQQGVQPTVGQAYGGMLGRAEEKLTSAPFVGDVVTGARRRAVEDFSDTAVATAAAPLQPGRAQLRAMQRADNPTEVMRDQIGAVYDNVLQGAGPIPQNVGDRVANEALQLVNDPLMTPQTRDHVLDYVQENILNRFQNGQIPAESWKEIDSVLGRESASFRVSPIPQDRRLGQALQDLQYEWRQGMAQYLPPGEGQRLTQANEAYRNLLRAERAASYGGRDQGLITPARLARAETTMAPKRPTGGRRIPQGDLAELAREGQEVLGTNVPNSGTIDRGAMLALALNPAKWLPAAGGYGLTGLTYSRPAQRLMTGNTAFNTPASWDELVAAAVARGMLPTSKTEK